MTWLIDLYGTHPFYLDLRSDGSAAGVFMLNSNAQEVVPFPRVEPCACGGSIYVDVQSGPNIQAAVRRHQDTARHRIWSADEYGP